MISDQAIEQVKAATDLPELVREYGVRLQKVAGGYVARCPFHDEKTASFRVHAVGARRGQFHCFGCGAGGGVISFLMTIEGLSFPKAVEYLADRAGITLDVRKPVTRVQGVANREDTECAAWWWARRRETVQWLFDEAMADPKLQPGDEWAACLGRMLRGIDGMKAGDKLQEFQFNVRGVERTEWRKGVEWNMGFERAVLEMARGV